MTRVWSLCLLWGWMSVGCLQGQVLIYDAMFYGEKVGTMTVNRHVSGNQSEIRAETHLAIRALVQTDLKVIYHSVFQDGKLLHSSTENQRDGRVIANSKGWQEGGNYHFTRDGQRRSYSQPIVHSATSMFFLEPRGVSQVFSERIGEYVPLERQSDGRYALKLPSGDINYYTYRNNQLTEIEINYGWFSMTYVLRQTPR